MLVAEIEKLEAEAAEHALAFQKVIGERAADRSSSGRLRRLRRLRRQAEHAERERGRMHAELQSELGCGGKHTSLLATAVTTGTMCEDDVRMRRQARALAAARGTPEQVLAEERATLEGVFVMKPQCLYISFAPSYTQSYIEVRTTGP